MSVPLIGILLFVTLTRAIDEFSCTPPASEWEYSANLKLCYWLGLDPRDADAGESACLSDGGHLAEIPDTSAMNTVLGLMASYGISGSEHLHLGYKQVTTASTQCRRPPNAFAVSDDQAAYGGNQTCVMAADLWAPNEPDYPAGGSCLAMNSSVASLRLVQCSQALKAVCFQDLATVGVKCTPDATDYQMKHMTLSQNEVDLWGNAIITCDEGYAFHVSTTPPEVVSNVSVRCVYKSADQSAKLEPYDDTYSHLECQAIACPAQPTIENAYTDILPNQTYIYGDTVTFNCTAGYEIVMGGFLSSPQLTSTCTATSQWDKTPKKCAPGIDYMKCYEAGALIDIVQLPLTKQSVCNNECKSRGFRFAASSSSGCACGNEINSTVSVMDAMQCNLSCPLYDDSGQVYCGGENNQQSVYHTLPDMCYKKINLDGIPTFSVTDNMLRTCKQRCLAEDVLYAILSDLGECACSNTSNVEGVVLSYTCEQKGITYNGTKHTVTSLFGLNPKHTSCSEVYEDKIKDNGLYNLKGKGKTYCNFKDGTVCPTGWIGYNDDCYLFTRVNYTFGQGVEYCRQNNATVASLLNEEQNNFAAFTIKSFIEFHALAETNDLKSWFIGLYDPNYVTAFTWNDGNLLLKQQFDSNQPNDEALNCVVIRQDTGYWYSRRCVRDANVICKQSSVQFCMYANTALTGVVWELQLEDMTLTKCIQACVSRSAKFALTKDDQCYCLNTLPTADKAPFTQCNRSCPANDMQACGGLLDGYYTVTKVANATRAASCEDLQSQGLSGDSYMLKDSTVATECNDTGCPYSWIKGNNSSCYKLMLGKKVFADAAGYCSNNSAYLLVMETTAEAQFIYGVINNLTFFQAVESWLFGLRMTGQYTNQYFWANGQRSYPLIQNVTDPRVSRRGFFTPSGVWDLTGSIEEMSYICEKNEGYLGCYNRPDSSLLVIPDYDYLSAEQCIESCRVHNMTYAMFHQRDCLCDNSLPEKNDDGCSAFCYSVQPCGSEGSIAAVSVYNTLNFPAYDTCESMFDHRILVSGEYLIDDAITTCYFYDNTTCPSGEWIGYRNKCYLFNNNEITQAEMVNFCRANNGNLLTITSLSEHDFLRKVLKVHSKFADTTVHRLGLLNEFGMGVATWVTGSIPSYYPRPSLTSTHTGAAIELTLTSDYDYVLVDRNADITGFCETNSDYVGCYNVPVDTAPIVDNYNNMELTQCKQICMGHGTMEYFALIQMSACYCMASIASLTPAAGTSCDVTCPGNSGQMCGGSDVVNVYRLAESDIQKSCGDLYKSGVLLAGNYRLNSSIAVCGQFYPGNSNCPIGWYSKADTCYRFIPGLMDYSQAEQTCLQKGGYICYPNTADSAEMVVELLPHLYPDTMLIWTSVVDFLMNTNLRSGDGWMITNTSYDVNENIYTLFNLTSGTWARASNGTYGVVCEKSSGYLGCKGNITELSPAQPSMLLEQDAMSATLCIQYCMGQEATYGAIQDNRCVCLKTSTGFIDTGDDCSDCAGYSAQPCGLSSLGSAAVYTLSHYSTNLLVHCIDFLNMGIWTRATFNIKPDENEAVRVSCFHQMKEHISVPSQYRSASSSVDPHTPGLSIVIGLELGPTANSVWIPSPSDEDDWLELDLQHDYVVMGILTQGRPDPSKAEWVTQYTVKYKSLLDESWKHVGTFDGNTDRTTVHFRRFVTPFVTYGVRIYPNGTLPALRVEVFGTQLTKINYTSTYIGCFAVFNTTGTEYVVQKNPVYSIQDCQNRCENTSSLYSFDSLALKCSCHVKLDGKLNQSECDNGISYAEEVHRLYVVNCEEPPSVNYSTNVTTFEHVPNVYTVTSSVEYTCTTGYEFLTTSSITKTITCVDQHVWDGQLGTDCTIISCPPIVAVNATIDTNSTYYDTEVVLACLTGYRLPDESPKMALRCQRDKTWNDTMSACQLVDCGEPPALTSTTQLGSVYTYSSSVAYVCDASTRVQPGVTSQNISCNANGTWDSVVGTCVQYECSDPPEVWETTFYRGNNTFATYTCSSSHYFPDGSDVRNVTCDSVSFVWETLPACLLDDTFITKKGVEIRLIDTKKRLDSPNILQVVQSESTIYCGDQCFRNTRCLAFNFNPNLLNDNCMLFNKFALDNVFEPSTDWSYFEMYEFTYFP